MGGQQVPQPLVINWWGQLQVAKEDELHTWLTHVTHMTNTCHTHVQRARPWLHSLPRLQNTWLCFSAEDFPFSKGISLLAGVCCCPGASPAQPGELCWPRAPSPAQIWPSPAKGSPWGCSSAEFGFGQHQMWLFPTAPQCSLLPLPPFPLLILTCPSHPSLFFPFLLWHFSFLRSSPLSNPTKSTQAFSLSPEHSSPTSLVPFKPFLTPLPTN